MLERARVVSQETGSRGRRVGAALAVALATAGLAAAAEPANPALGLREARGGTTALVGATVWVTPDRKLEEATLLVQPEADDEATVLVRVPYSGILRHRGYAAPNEHGFQVTVG